jgi:ribosomal protein S18 acetylase RimI-like enzyme
MEVDVRDARPEDAPTVANLLDDLGYPASAPDARGRLRRLADDPASRILVAVDSGNVVGLAALHVMRLLERDAPAAHVTALVVAAEARRRRIGTALVAALEQEAKERGCDRLVLGSAERRADAHAFYAGLGYEETGRRFAKALR